MVALRIFANQTNHHSRHIQKEKGPVRDLLRSFVDSSNIYQVDRYVNTGPHNQQLSTPLSLSMLDQL